MIYTLIGVFIAGLIYLFLDFRIKDIMKEVNVKKNSLINDLKNNGTIIEIDTRDCLITNNDVILKPNYYKSESINNSEMKYLHYFKYKRQNIIKKKTKLICNYFNEGKLIKQYIKYYSLDSTVFEFKFRLKNKIYIYVNDDNYYIDVEFLND